DIPDINLNDVPTQLEATLNHRRSRSSHVSLFNMDLAEFMIDSTVVDTVEQHQKRANEEEKKWYTLVSTAVKSSKEMATREYNFEPREEQQRYLKECPNLQNFIRGSLPFMNKVTRFLAEHQELVALQDELAEHVQFQLNSDVSNALHENLAGKR
ncbi:hypothetical protein KR038_002538, partial [Drosophila bunnanda]